MTTPSAAGMPRVAVVIPTLNEAATIASAIRAVRAEAPDELVVADGGSSDATVMIARDEGALVIETERGRGTQQNAGALATGSELLLFLHADCRIEPGGLARLRRFSRDHPLVPGGCFRMRVESPGAAFRAIDRSADLRAGILGIPYGDQAIFVRRRIWEACGGFPEIPLMEDVFFSFRIRRRGRIAVLPSRVFVSPRRWQARGLVRQTLLNWSLTLAATMAVPPTRLARYYPPVR